MVLEEVGGELGTWLWHSLQDVLLWARTAPRERGHVFHPGAPAARAGLRPALDAALEDAAAVLDALVAEPVHARAAEVAGACRGVAEWAEAGGRVGTALAWAEAAACAAPEDPAPAAEAARLAVARAEYARAEVWVKRSAALARAAREWRGYARALAYGARAAQARGDAEGALRMLARARRAAARWGLTDLLPAIQEELLALDTGATEDPGGEAGDPQSLRRAYDRARAWVERGEPRRALPLLWALRPALGEGAPAALAVALLARAAAALGDSAVAERAWADARGWASGGGAPADAAARVLLDLGHAAAALGAADRAGRCAADAARRGEAAGDVRLVLEAEGLRERLGRRGEAERGEPGAAEVRAAGLLVREYLRAVERAVTRHPDPRGGG